MRPFCLLLLLGCVLSAAGVSAVAADEDVKTARKFVPNIDLPDSAGKDLILRGCTNCHDLGGLAAYKGYWNRAQWKAMVEDMVKNGAPLQAAEQDIVADYLTRHFGPGTRQ